MSSEQSALIANKLLTGWFQTDDIQLFVVDLTHALVTILPANRGFWIALISVVFRILVNIPDTALRSFISLQIIVADF